jgi:F-type H+-transporting ATPase subunit gamma
MASLKDTKRRIVSVKNTQKITKAMKLVSAAKFARANQAVLRARPYAQAFEKLVAKITNSAKTENPLLEARPKKKTLVVVIATDRGLCGGLNSNLLKKATAFIRENQSQGASVELALWGKRSHSLGRLGQVVVKEKKEKVLEKINFASIKETAQSFCKLFESKTYDSISLVYPKFLNAMTQTPQCETLLPLPPPTEEKGAGDAGTFLFEPSVEELSEGLIRDLIATKIYGFLLEVLASEHAARMTAMDNATNNAKDVIKKLTLDYNRARQANITKELIEITSGAQALN